MGSRRSNIKQVWVPYWEWEDWLNGMWKKGDESTLNEAIEFTGDHVRYGAAMGEVIAAWSRTMLNSLTNTSINRRAFLGHCAVCFKLGISEDITRQAWGFLTEQQRIEADAEATKHIKQYEETYRAIYQNLGESLLS
jgi:hypothetical protein